LASGSRVRISVAVRWYLRYGLSYRDVEELLAERGVTVDHVSIYRWVQRFTPELAEATRPGRHAPGDRWFVDETYVKVAGQWAYLYRAIDQHGQVVDVLLSVRRDLAAARRFFIRAMQAGTIPVDVTTDRAHVYLLVLDELIPSALHTFEQYANNPIEADHGRLKARLRPMRGLKSHRSVRILAAGHAFVQNVRRGHYDIATDATAGCPVMRGRLLKAVAHRSRPYPGQPLPIPATRRGHPMPRKTRSDTGAPPGTRTPNPRIKRGRSTLRNSLSPLGGRQLGGHHSRLIGELAVADIWPATGADGSLWRAWGCSPGTWPGCGGAEFRRLPRSRSGDSQRASPQRWRTGPRRSRPEERRTRWGRPAPDTPPVAARLLVRAAPQRRRR
jgi:transposase, IS6 family